MIIAFVTGDARGTDWDRSGEVNLIEEGAYGLGTGDRGNLGCYAPGISWGGSVGGGKQSQKT